MKHLIIIFSFLTSFYSIFAQGDSAATRRKINIENKARIRADSFNARAKTIWVKADSFRVKADSFRFKANQKSASVFSYNNNYKTYRSFDSVVYDNYDKDTLVKEVTMEVNCNPDATIFIENINRKLVIKTSTDNKVKITTTVKYSADSKLTDVEWFQKLNLELKSNNNQVVLKSDNLNNNLFGVQTTGIRTITINGQTPASNSINLQNNITNLNNLNSAGNIYDIDGHWLNKRISISFPRVVTVYIPAGAKLDVESKYADVDIQDNLKNIKADITNANLRFMDVEIADIQSKYGRIYTGNIKKADIELTNGKFYGKDIYSAKFNSKYSSIECGVTNDLKIESINDQYEIDEVGDLIGKKNYGNIRITNLKRSFDLTGNNADIKIRYVDASVSNIKIDNKYADIRIPVNNLANYSVDFDGKNCNVYAPFEKIPVIKIEEKKKDPEVAAVQSTESKQPNPAKAPTPIGITGFKSLTFMRTVTGYTIDAKDENFKATVGDTKNKHATINVKCTNCTVDFK